MVNLSGMLRSTSNITNGKELFKYLMRECRQLPPGVQDYYKHFIRQSYKQHKAEKDPERIREIIQRSLEDGEWVLKKYRDGKVNPKP
ncbi:hypothetical protein B566_EDAN010351 [Ephemera danica]|nr:hypothetical protein B566_EDAN010351 [Ephemera danica]